MFSLLRAGWGKVNSLGIWRMRGVLLWLRTKCNPPISPISEPRTELFVGELDRPYRASERFEQGLSPPCVVTQILHVFWHSKLKSLSCLAQATSLMDWIPPYTWTYQNLLSNEGVTCSIFFFCLAGKSRFLGCLSSQPAQLYHEGQKERRLWSSLQRSKGRSTRDALCTSFKLSWESIHYPPNTLLLLKKYFYIS